MSQVYLVAARATDSPTALAARIDALWRRAALDDVFKERDLAALKLHVGEPGTKTFVAPPIVAELVRHMAATGAKPFLTDTAVLYRSPRDNAVSHARVARDHGFSPDAVGAPFLSADGLNGAEEIELPLAGGSHFDHVVIASGIMHARSMLVLSHATGHLGTGLGGALKNLGMGCASKKGKLRMHHGQQPRIDDDACTGCGTCADWCPADAIEVAHTAAIDAEACIGCGECIAVCRDDAVEFDWHIMGRQLQERIVEYAAAVIRSKPGRIAYVTVAQNITRDCDCLGVDQRPLLEDIGLLASRDPVAIDEAALTLVEQRAGRTLESMSYPRLDARDQIRHALGLGLGSSDFELVEVS